MKRIAILADTHGLLRPEVIAQMKTVDVIVHAGDINTQAIVDKLHTYGVPVYIVRGNNDKEWAKELPASLSFTVEGIQFFMIHRKQDIPHDLTGVNGVIYGHSHKYACQEQNGVLWLNPGNCGRRRFDQEITFAMMEIDNGRFHVEKIVIPHEVK